MSFFGRKKQVIIIDRSLVVAACEIAAAQAYAAEVTKQTCDQLGPGMSFTMTKYNVTLKDVTFDPVTCDTLEFEWR